MKQLCEYLAQLACCLTRKDIMSICALDYMFFDNFWCVL